jgi:hypothetical protein
LISFGLYDKAIAEPADNSVHFQTRGGHATGAIA